ncbi:hypothetical protein [Methylocella silvestris]|uniref:hypothetical protein n=1 Tax=Methylocella silvestris TaxID=199596 RepID=UPI0011D089E4|nr:hypothetical protein [Methylocella silvestris]
MNRQIMTFAVLATLLTGGAALADSTTKTSPPAAGSDANATDKGATGNGGMAGSPAAAETPNVEGKSGSQSGAHPSDKMAPETK